MAVYTPAERLENFNSTTVLYPAGICQCKSSVVMVIESPRFQDEYFLVTEKTPFHPLSYSWPDQPGDTGTITLNGNRVKVQNCVVAALNKSTHQCYLDQEIPPKSQQLGEWSFFVAHGISNKALANKKDIIGKDIDLEVDFLHRKALSGAHSACHLVSLALNKATHCCWKKATHQDSLGSYNFDQAAIFKSAILPNQSHDIYRLGKSLKKQGFNEDTFLQLLDSGELYKQCDEQIAEWLGNQITMQVEPGISKLDEKRIWNCTIEKMGRAFIPCGGTHVSSFEEVQGMGIGIKKMEPSSAFPDGTYVELETKVIWKQLKTEVQGLAS